MQTINLYSKRFTVARGWVWKYERECMIVTSEKWLEVFQNDEPMVEFKLANKTPKV